MKCIKGYTVGDQKAPCETCPQDAQQSEGFCGAQCTECWNGTYIAVALLEAARRVRSILPHYVCDSQECGHNFKIRR